MEFKEPQKNKKKQIIISTIYVVIFLLLVSAVVYSLKPKPNCFDGKLNQNEKNVDCGGVCAKKCVLVAEEPIQVVKTGYVPSGIANKYDIFGQIYNPNNFLGSNEFAYTFLVKDALGKVIAEKKGMNFVLPGERKYLIEGNLEILEAPVTVELTLEGIKWVEFSAGDYQKPDLKIVNKAYNEINSGVTFSEALGLLKNESQFDFATIKIYIILKSPSDEIIALNSTLMNTVKSGENRDFRAFWPNRFSGEVRTVETQVDVDVYKSDSFVKRFFNTEQFQEY